MSSSSELVTQAAAQVREISGISNFDIAVIPGSGWSGAAELLGPEVANIPVSDVAGFSGAAIAGHQATLRVFTTPTGKNVLVMGGRQHYYQGRNSQRVAHAPRLAAALGCQQLILTNGCGSTRPDWGPGTVVLISDHINFTGDTPLEGADFIDLTDLYAARLREIALQVDAQLPAGVYMQFTGPQYETPTEVRMARTLGADLVGMSTALEAIAARAAGLEVLGLSLVTNLGAGIGGNLDHADVIAAGQAAAPRIAKLLADIIYRL